MKTFLLLIAYCLLLIFPVSAQITFQKTYGGADSDQALSVAQTSDGGYIVAGYTFSYGAGGSDAYLLKTNAYGDTMWTKTYGGTGADLAYSVEQTFDGG